MRERNVLDVATLLTWERKGEEVLFEKLFKSNEDFYGIAGLLWEFILKYHPERATQATPPTKRKILMKVDADNTTGLSRFVFSEYTQSKRAPQSLHS